MSRMRHSNRRSRALLTAALVALPPVVPSAVAHDTAPTVAPPVARRKPTVRELHGDTLDRRLLLAAREGRGPR